MKLRQVFSKWFSTKSVKTPAPVKNDNTVGRDGLETPTVVKSVSAPADIDESTPEKPTGRVGRSLPAGITVARDKLHIHVGVDFGTSATKVAYQLITKRGRQIKALPFNHGLASCPWFGIPSVAAFNGEGRFLIGRDAAYFLADKPCQEGLRYLKLILAGQRDESFLDPTVNALFMENLARGRPGSSCTTVQHIIVAFLASLFSDIRSKLLAEFSGQELDLTFNVCAPIDHLQSNPLKATFEKILAAAEDLEPELSDVLPSNDLLEVSALAFESVNIEKSRPEKRVFLIPESVGAIASYLASLRLKNGIHAVYDFGAGTTDISIFQIWSGKGQPFTYWYAARNLPRGARRIERLVTEAFQTENPNDRFSDSNLLNAMSTIAEQPSSLQDKIRDELRELWEDSHVAWREAYGRHKKQSDWEKEKVQVYVCGGTCGLPSVKDIFCHSWMSGWGPYRISDLPGPDVYDLGSANAPFNRLCVAYGLTTPEPELGQYILPKDCPDTTPEKLMRPIPSVYGSFDPDA